jgi:multicomponent Na+:H+ antiporter subunit G
MPVSIDTLLELCSALCLLIGSFLCLSGGVGILRFPDFYTRMHAVGVTDTLAASMILIGLMLQSPEMLVIIKLVMILLMTLFINPTASHALAKAAFHNGLLPLCAGKACAGKAFDGKEHDGKTLDDHAVNDKESKSSKH